MIALRGWKLGVDIATAAVPVVTNMAIGFVAGLAVAYLVRTLKRHCVLPCLCP